MHEKKVCAYASKCCWRWMFLIHKKLINKQINNLLELVNEKKEENFPPSVWPIKTGRRTQNIIDVDTAEESLAAGSRKRSIHKREGNLEFAINKNFEVLLCCVGRRRRNFGDKSISSSSCRFPSSHRSPAILSQSRFNGEQFFYWLQFSFFIIVLCIHSLLLLLDGDGDRVGERVNLLAKFFNFNLHQWKKIFY